MESLRIGVLICSLIIATYTDLAYQKIYNWLTIPVLGMGIGLCAGEVILNDDYHLAYPVLICVGMVLLIFLVPYLLKWLGAGDLKFLLALACLQGAPFGPVFFLKAIYHITLFGALLAILTLIWRGKFLSGLKSSFKVLVNPKKSNSENAITIPYGLAISMGMFYTFIVVN